MNEAINDSCIICYNSISVELLCKTNCNHIYCKDCLHTWFNRGKIECPMCRVNVKSYENNGIQNHLIVLNTLENRIVIEANTDNIENPNIGNTNIENIHKKVKYMKYYFVISMIYMGYLHYKNYTLWDDCNT